MSQNIVETLGDYAQRAPDAPALIEGLGAKRRITTFGQVNALSAAWAKTLAAHGVRTGDHVLILQSISSELYLALLAVFRLGAVAVFPDPQSLRATIEAACERARPVAMIGGWPAQTLRLVSRPLRHIPQNFTASWTPWATKLPREGSTPEPAANVAHDHPALITFTSGSTGAPKIIARSHGFLGAQHAAITRAVTFVPGTATLTALPVFVLSHLASGVTSILPASDVRRPKETDPGPLLAQIAENKAHTILASPALVERLSRAEAAHDKLATVRDVLTGGGPIFLDIIDGAALAMPAARIHLAYGSTEAEPIAHLTDDEIDPADRAAMDEGAGLLAGRPTKGTDVAVLRDAWGRPLGPLTQAAFDTLRLPAEQAGEIVVAGDHVVASYVNGEGNTETKIAVDGRIWHRTGDAGAFDAKGRLWLKGRCAARLKEGLYPLQVEAMVRANLGPVPVAAIPVNGEPTLVLEGGAGRIEEKARRLGITKIRTLRKIPLDRRHQSKIDYATLKKLLT